MNLISMFNTADEHGECTAKVESGTHIDDLRIAVMTEGYIFRTDGRSFAVIKNRRQPIQYAKTGTV